MKHLVFASLVLMSSLAAMAQTPPLTVSVDGRSLQAGGETFFWLGDTGWLMLSRLDRAETEHYLRTRKEQGFNVIQAMILHNLQLATLSGVPALIDGDPARPHVTPGSDPEIAGEYDFWDHLDWVVKRSQEHGIYLALVPSWGSLADRGLLNTDNASIYGQFLAERYRDQPNIIWLNGGDVHAMDKTETWSMLGRTIKKYDPDHLMTYHPIGRSDSSWTFHNARWLDFNMYQSGHRSYALDPDARGEDNWSYAEEDWARTPAKPTIDGEPSYENIPDGLHRADVRRWQAADVRRYAWWAILSGAFGHTYGENSVMQMFVPGRDDPAFHAELHWDEGLQSPGAKQMRYVKDLMLSRPFAQRQPAAGLVVDNGQRYDRIPVLRGPNYMIAYTYTGRVFTIRLGTISGDQISASWYSPRNGEVIPIRLMKNEGEAKFDPPGDAVPGNDWVLLLDDADAEFTTSDVTGEG